jgi:hypothetical protein
MGSVGVPALYGFMTGGLATTLFVGVFDVPPLVDASHPWR